MMYLIFINGLGPNYKGDNMYEFIFTDELEGVWDDSWLNRPAYGSPKPPHLDFISKVGVLKDTEIQLELVQHSDYFSFSDSIDGVIALGWEKDELDSDFTKTKRLVFKYGETEEEIKDKLYERDIVLEFEKKVVYEN